MVKRWILATLAACALAVGAAGAVHADVAPSQEEAPPTIDCQDCNWD